MWLDSYTADLDPNLDDFRADLEALWQDMKPLYEKLHGYIRYLPEFGQGRVMPMGEQ